MRVPKLGDIRWLDVDLPRDGSLLLEAVLLGNLRISEHYLISIRDMKTPRCNGDLRKIVLVELERVRLPQ